MAKYIDVDKLIFKLAAVLVDKDPNKPAYKAMIAVIQRLQAEPTVSDVAPIADTVREMQERVESYIDVGHYRPPTEICFSELDVVNIIRKIAKEMLEGEK